MRRILAAVALRMTIVLALLSSVSAVARGQYIFVVNAYGNTIGEYNATTGAVVNATLVSGLNNTPNCMAESGTDLFVTNWGNGTIGEYSHVGGSRERLPGLGLEYPYGIAISGSDLFVANYGNGTIGEYTPRRGPSSRLAGLGVEWSWGPSVRTGPVRRE